ncbi:putative mitochondrial protein, partial [Mucuna pruriens]
MGLFVANMSMLFMLKKIDNCDILLVCFYVDDLIFTGKNPNGIFFSQESYAKKVLEKFKMFDCNPMNTPMEGSLKLSRFDSGEKEDPTLFKSLVGSLRYLTSTRLDIMYAVGVVCRFMEAPTSTHMKAAKRILRYLKGTLDFGLFYSSSNEFKLMGFCDSDFVGDVDDRKSTTGFVFFMSGCAFTWNSKKQAIVTLSTCDAEFVAATSYTKRRVQKFILIINLHKFLLRIWCFMNKANTDTRYHFNRECIVKKEVGLVHVKTQD